MLGGGALRPAGRLPAISTSVAADDAKLGETVLQTGAAAVALVTLEIETDATLEAAIVLAELASRGVVTAAAKAGVAAEDGSKTKTPPAPTVRLVPAAIADELAKMSVPAETVVPPV